MMKNGFNLGLRGKLAIIIIAAVVIGVGTVGAISIFSMRSEMEKQIKDAIGKKF